MQVNFLDAKPFSIHEERTYSNKNIFQKEIKQDPRAIRRMSNSAKRKAESDALSQENVKSILHSGSIKALPPWYQEKVEKEKIMLDPRLRNIIGDDDEILDIELFQLSEYGSEKVYHVYTDYYIIAVNVHYIESKEPFCGPAKFELEFHDVSKRYEIKDTFITPWEEHCSKDQEVLGKIEKEWIQNDPRFKEIIGDEEIVKFKFIGRGCDEGIIQAWYQIFTKTGKIEVQLQSPMAYPSEYEKPEYYKNGRPI